MNQLTPENSGFRSNVFRNDSTVSNQAGVQNIAGSVYHNYGHSQPTQAHDRLLQLQERRLIFRNSLRFNQIEARYTTIKSAHLKTCRWLLTRPEYTAWHRDEGLPKHHGLLWIKGKPATGKSTIMKFAFAKTEEQEANTIILAFFFNARGEELEKSTTGMYRSLLFQLLCKHPEYLDVFDTFRVGLQLMNPSDWDNAALVDIFSSVVKRLRGHRVVCFVDALDECNEEDVRDMISVFESIGRNANESGIPFRICFSSRHYPHITVSYGISLVLEEQVEHDQDLRQYLETELRIGLSRTAVEVRHELLQRASGIFLWVVLVTRILNKEYDRGQMSALKKRLNDIPDDLGALFNDLLTREGSPAPELALCIQWVLYARVPLRPEELYFAIISGTDPESVSIWNSDEMNQQDIQRYILNCSRGLVEQTKGDSPTIQFIHESVRDYFLTGRGLHNSYTGSAPSFIADGHDKLKRCCEMYYSRAYDLRDLIVPKNANTRKLFIFNTLLNDTMEAFPFFKYAIDYVFYHAEEAQKYGCSQENFLEGFAMAPWVTLCNLLHPFESYPLDVSLLYVLADDDLSQLTKLFCQQNRVTTDSFVCGKFTSPLKAALARGYANTLEVLLTPTAGGNSDNLAHAWANPVGRDEIPKAVTELLRNTNILKEPSAFTQAARDGHLSAIKCMIRSEWHGEICNIASALKAASERGHEKVVQALINIGADVNTQSGFFGNILHAASVYGHEKVVQTLIDAGAEVNAPGSYFGNALQGASVRGHEKVVQVLINAGAKVNAQGGYYGNALQAASAFGHTTVVQLLIDEGADVSAQGGYHGSALQAVLDQGHEDVKQLLINAGANPTQQPP